MHYAYIRLSPQPRRKSHPHPTSHIASSASFLLPLSSFHLPAAVMMPHLWTPHNQSIDDEIKHKLECTRYQWKSTRMEDDDTVIRKYEETIKCLMQRLKTVCQERDEARHQIQVLLRKLQPSTPQDTINKKSSASAKHYCSSDMSYKSFTTSHCDISLVASFDRKKDSDYYVTPNSRNMNMIDKLVCGKPLPRKGRLLRTVTEAGPLLHTLLLEPLPQWRNPPPFDNDNDKVDDVIPTSLSLAFHGNSRMSSPSLDANPGIAHINHNNFTGNKRRFCEG